MEDNNFRLPYGTLYSGLDLDIDRDKRGSVLLFPFLFLMRRVIFVYVIISLSEYTWLQIASQFACCIFMIIYLGYVWPFTSHMLTKLELFNEVTTLFLFYGVMCFTDWVPKAEIRYLCGWVFMAILFTHLGSHLSLLIARTFVKIKHKAKRKYKKKKDTK